MIVLVDGESVAGGNCGLRNTYPKQLSLLLLFQMALNDLVELINVTNEPANELDDLVIFWSLLHP